MTRIIPAPALVRAGDGSYVLPARLRIGGALDAVAAPVSDFGTRLHELTARDLEVVTDLADADVRLSLDDVDFELEGVDATRGVSPVGRDPRDERYVLRVDPQGVDIRAASPEGLARALATLTQMVSAAADGGTVELEALTILDAPRFAWRGLSFDVVRTFFEAATVRQVIDMLALHKLNVLHLHLTDDQGWRIEIPELPRLTEIGSTGAVGDRLGGFYTVEDYASLISYAAERFVTIVPEIDVPGHTAAIFAADPELRSPLLGDAPFSFLDPRTPETAEFLRTVFSSLAAMTPGAFMHIGGDESFGMPEQLYRDFLALVLPIVRATGKKVVGWQEIARGDLTADDIAQYWVHGIGNTEELLRDLPVDSPFHMSEEQIVAMSAQFAHASLDLPKAQAQGARVILSPSSVAYFDTPYAETSLDDEQESRRSVVGLAFYPPKTVEQSFDWQVSTVVPEADPDAVAGVEAAIWCETVETAADLHMLLLPRLAGIAEKAWSLQDGVGWEQYAGRLGAQAPLWRASGWHFFQSSTVPWR